MANKVRLSDIAEKAEVSTTTVSQVLLNKGRVSEETRVRIERIAHEMGYTAKKKQSDSITVGVLISLEHEMSYLWNYYREFIHSLNFHLKENGHKLIMIPFDKNITTQEMFDKIKSNNVNALVLFLFATDELYHKLEDNGIVTVTVFDDRCKDRSLCLRDDDFQGAYDLVRYLIGLGHNNIGYIFDRFPLTTKILMDVKFGIDKALMESNLTLSQDNILEISTEDTMEKISDLLEIMLDSPHKPTAIFCHHDILANKVYHSLNNLGYNIPIDISIVATGDLLDYTGNPPIPQITTMKTQNEHMGALCFEIIHNKLFHENPRQHISLKVQQRLVDRGSCSYHKIVKD